MLKGEMLVAKFSLQVSYLAMRAIYGSLRWRGSVVERRSLAGELSLSCA